MRYKTANGSFLDYESVPMRLWQKAKKYGIWNPNDFDFSKDKEDFKTLQGIDQAFTLRTLSQFIAGEEAVTLDLLPLMMAVAKEGRIEEEMYLTSFLWEEAKHVDVFNRFFNEVIPNAGSLEEYVGPSWKLIFNEILPNAMNALLVDPSPENQAKASVTYNMIVEGMLAETGYYSFFQTMEKYNIMPGLRAFIAKLKQDESRHIAYGVFLLSRLISEHGDPLYRIIREQMKKLLPLALRTMKENYTTEERFPFEIDTKKFLSYGLGQFTKRMRTLKSARHLSIEEMDFN